MKSIPVLAATAMLAFLAPVGVLADSGCKAPAADPAPDAHTHCGMSSATKAQDAIYKATGSITRVDRAAGNVTIAHDPIAELKWPAMTMRFGVRDKGLLERLSPGKKVEFQFVQQGAQYLVTAVN